jgi:para-aminobenzoate synthetase component I
MAQPIAYLNTNDGTGLLAFGNGPSITISGKGSIRKLQEFIDQNKGKYLFGYLSYDLKNDIENLSSANEDCVNFPDLHFWVPDVVIDLRKEHFNFLQGSKSVETFDFLNKVIEEETDRNFHRFPYQFLPRIDKKTYIEKVNKLKSHIQRGDIYEVNFCQEYFAENVELNFELDTYFRLNELTKAPFSSYLHFGNHVVFCGSPERFIKRTDNKLISQPIKGTAPRSKDAIDDDRLKNELLNDPKERAENVMIVDLVRNDLSKIAKKNSVHVDELFGIYSFETVHQMISTISCEIESTLPFTEIIRATFPMGSMTGAPKYRAMELIEEHEDFKRGLYSGSIGYIAPNGDFDFNVVIRSLLYNREKQYLSCSVGSAITINSDPEKEYEECLVKIQRILNGMNE